MTFSYKNPLRLTSPLISGDRVKEAQKLLAGDGPLLKRKCYGGTIDGQYGEHTAHATKSAKYWLGYPRKKIDEAFGETLYLYLTGKKKISLYMRWLRRHRLKLEKKHKTTGGLYKRAITEAVKYLGVKESPYGSNRQEFGAWYGMNGVPWCAIFVSYCLSHVGHFFKYSYCPAIVAAARAGQNSMAAIPWSDVAHAISVGHPVLALYCWDGSGIAEHVEFVESVQASSFIAVGGNTAPPGGSQNNGGEVCRNTRYPSEVVCFAVVYGK